MLDATGKENHVDFATSMRTILFLLFVIALLTGLFILMQLDGAFTNSVAIITAWSIVFPDMYKGRLAVSKRGIVITNAAILTALIALTLFR